MSDQALEALVLVLNAALESVPPQTRKILQANAQGPINDLAKRLEKAPTPLPASPPA